MSSPRMGRNLLIAAAILSAPPPMPAISFPGANALGNYIKKQIVTRTQDAIGGRVEVGGFSFDLFNFRAVITNFVIHGKEPASAPPFLSVARIQVDIRLFNGKLFTLAYLGIQKPQVNILQFADGTTNIPSPPQQQTSSSNTSALQTVVDLAVGHLDLTNGLIVFQSRKIPLNVRGNDLVAQLYYDRSQKNYHGNLGLNPLYVAQGRETPVDFRVNLPVSITADSVEIPGGSITSTDSALSFAVSVSDMNNPVISARLNGHLGTGDIQKLSGAPLDVNAKDVPQQFDIATAASMANGTIRISNLNAAFGETNLTASGVLQSPRANPGLNIRASVDLGQLGRLAKMPQRPDGTILLNANAKLNQAYEYNVTGNIEAENVALTSGGQRIRNIDLRSAFDATPKLIDLKDIRASAFGGNFRGNIELADFNRYTVQGRLGHFDVERLAKLAGQKVPYNGILSGTVNASGDLKTPPNSLVAKVRLAIVPGRGGIPLSGRLNVDYNAARNDVTVIRSYIAVPGTRVDLNGSANRRLDISAVSHDLRDILAAAPLKGPPPVTLTQPAGVLAFHGAVTHGLSNPHVAGRLTAQDFKIEGQAFSSLNASLAASPSAVSVQNGVLSRGTMQATFDASVGLRRWSLTPRSPLTANASIQNAELADLVAMAGQPAEGYAGVLDAAFHLTGTVGNPNGAGTLNVTSGKIDGQPFQQIHAEARLSDQLFAIPVAYIQIGSSRLDLTAQYQHPSDSFLNGTISAHVQTAGLDLAGIELLHKQVNAAGVLRADADLSGKVMQIIVSGQQQTSFMLNAVNANASASNLRLKGDQYGDLNLTARTQGNTVAYNLSLVNAGSGLRVTGQTTLTRNYPLTATVSIASFPISKVLNLANRTDLPASGILSGQADIRGTVYNPYGSAGVLITKADIYHQPIDAISLRAEYAERSVNIPQLQIIINDRERIDMSARYDHPPGDLNQGNATFSINSTPIDLASIHEIEQIKPGLAGTLEIHANGAGAVQPNTPRVLVSALNANISANAISDRGRNIGNLQLTANTTSQNHVNVALDSTLLGASIQGSASAVLTGDYPVDGQLTFNNVNWTPIEQFIGSPSESAPRFDASAAGRVTVNGPLLNPDQLSGSLDMPKLAVTLLPPTPGGHPIPIANQGPLQIVMNKGDVRVQSFRLTGPDTDLSITGGASLPAKTLDLSIASNLNPALAHTLDPDITASGKITTNLAVRGTFTAPQLNGQSVLENVSANYAAFPNGISNANGRILFNGNNAQIQNITGESGGGKVTVSGFFGYATVLRFGVRAAANNVRLRVQQGVSVTITASVQLIGTEHNSIATGTATVEQLTYAPQSDIGSLLTRAAPPVQTPSSPSPFLDNMKLDVRIRTSTGLAVQASLAQNLQVDADMRIRGTASSPGMTGRVNIYSGQLVFFGATYTLDQGSIAFYNPIRIDPVLDVSLETTAQGVHVVLHVTGPIDNLHFSYTSDPPLQFQEIVALLAAGSTPTSDATVLAQQPSQPPQSLQQRGESALLGSAVADPIASRLQRVFGITQLKISPSFISGSTIPTARLTLQQRITQNLTFTYVEDLRDPNATIVKVEWAFSNNWSAVAQRDQNGIFSVIAFYKRQFR